MISMEVFRFVSVKTLIYAHPEDGVIARVEQALCAFIHLTWQDGTAPKSFESFYNLDRIFLRQLSDIHEPLAHRYKKT